MGRQPAASWPPADLPHLPGLGPPAVVLAPVWDTAPLRGAFPLLYCVHHSRNVTFQHYSSTVTAPFTPIPPPLQHHHNPAPLLLSRSTTSSTIPATTNPAPFQQHHHASTTCHHSTPCQHTSQHNVLLQQHTMPAQRAAPAAPLPSWSATSSHHHPSTIPAPF